MDNLRIISLGGFNNVTQNMFAYHFLPKGQEEGSQILLVDAGVGFPEEDLFGVDLIIPDFSYVSAREDKIVGLILTHGHEDHIGALPWFLSQIKKNIPVRAAKLAAAMATDKLEEFGINKTIEVFREGDKFKLGNFLIEPIRVTHSIPDTFHFVIGTPIGNFYHGADFKFDFTPVDHKQSELGKISRAGSSKVVALLSDCLGSEHQGYSPSERELGEMFEDQMRKAKGRVFVTAISSNIYRWQQTISASVKFGRKIALAGMSVEKNIKLAQQLGYLDLNNKDLIRPEKVDRMADSKVTVLVGGSLGQSGSSLDKIVFGKHKISIRPTDKIIFSSPDYIPGTSTAIYQLIDNLAKRGIEVAYSEIEGGLHVSGHASQQELALLVNLVDPHWIIPIGGNYRHMKQFSLLTKKMGFNTDNVIIPEENQALIFDNNGFVDKKLSIPTRRVLVDGFGVGDVGQTVLRDRQTLAKDGMLVVVFLVNSSKGLLGKPSVVSRGFVYVKENKALIKKLEKSAAEIFEKGKEVSGGSQALRQYVQGRLEEIIYKETGRQPMILPLIIEM